MIVKLLPALSIARCSLLIAAFSLLIAHCSLLIAHAEDMLLIPEGEFIMGSGERDGRLGIDYGVDEIPQRKVFVKDFYIDKYEVTNAEYREYLNYLVQNRVRLPFYEDIGIPIPEDWRYPEKTVSQLLSYKEGMENHPVSDVDWYMASGYCQWKGKRLPTEEEWEKAARGTDGRKYPWGNEENKGYANTRGQKTEDEKMRRYEDEKNLSTSAVGSFQEDVSPYGMNDMGGNVAEWTSSLYRPYSGSPVAGREAFKRIKCYIGIPEKYKDSKKISFEKENKLKFIRTEEVFK